MGFQLNQGFPQAKLNEIHGAWGDTKNMAAQLTHFWVEIWQCVPQYSHMIEDDAQV